MPNFLPHLNGFWEISNQNTLWIHLFQSIILSSWEWQMHVPVWDVYNPNIINSAIDLNTSVIQRKQTRKLVTVLLWAADAKLEWSTPVGISLLSMLVYGSIDGVWIQQHPHMYQAHQVLTGISPFCKCQDALKHWKSIKFIWSLDKFET